MDREITNPEVLKDLRGYSSDYSSKQNSPRMEQNQSLTIALYRGVCVCVCVLVGGNSGRKVERLRSFPVHACLSVTEITRKDI